MGADRPGYNWEKLLADAAMLQAKVPSAILVGGTAAALHAGHRISFDHDHVVQDLSEHFDETNAALSYHIGLSKGALALEEMNRLYREFAGEGGDILLSIVLKLTNPDPYDLTEVDLSEYKGIVKPRSSWNAVEKQCRDLALELVGPRPE
ncbi:MAG TPA: hypothetical protein VMW69_07795 [Spirochaetia bacterium]|nr:hypothetical protein [Spirochaetia bacterium]